MWVPPTHLSYPERHDLDTFIQIVFKNAIQQLHTESIVEVLGLEERKETDA